MLHYPPLKKIKILLNLKQSISQFHQNVLLVQLMNHLICLSSCLELQPLSSHCTFCPRQKVPCTCNNLQLSLIVKELLTASLQIPCYLRTLWKMKPTRALSKPKDQGRMANQLSFHSWVCQWLLVLDGWIPQSLGNGSHQCKENRIKLRRQDTRNRSLDRGDTREACWKNPR